LLTFHKDSAPADRRADRKIGPLMFTKIPPELAKKISVP